MSGKRNPQLWNWLLLAALLVALLPAGVLAQPGGPGPLSPNACIDDYTPENSGNTHDGADTLDKCVTDTFTSNGTTKRIVVFYTDTDNASMHRASQTNAEDVLDAAIAAWQAFVNQGFNEPRHNGGQGGSGGDSNDKNNRFDVWIEHDNGDGWWGIAWWHPSDHVSIHAPLARLAEGTALKRDATVFHEIFHRVQYSYGYPNPVKDNYSANAWIVEGGARHMQDEVSSDVDNDADGRFRGAANSYLGAPQTNLRNRSYIAGLWWKYFAEQLGENAGAATAGTPGKGVDAIETFYLNYTTADDIGGLRNATSAEGGGSLNTFFQRFTTANYAKDYTSGQARYRYLDDDLVSWNSVNLSENRSPGASGYYNVSRNQDPWAARYFQLNLTSACTVVNYTFTSSSGDSLGFDVMTVGGSNNLVDHWSSTGTSFNKSFINDGYTKAVGVVTTFDAAATYDVDFGCVSPTLDIERPQQIGSGSPALVGPFNDPIPFTVRLRVGAGGSATLEGLEAGDFAVTVGGAAAPVLGSAYVLDRYWLSVDTPTQGSNGLFDLEVELLGTASDAEPLSVLYSERGTNDVIAVLDISGSMNPAKLAAAKDAYQLLVNEVAVGDFGGLVTFSGDGTELIWIFPGWGAQNNDAQTVFTLQEIPNDATRDALRNAVNPVPAGGWTSVGDGLLEGVEQYDSNGSPEHLCTVILLSDGDENEGTLYQGDPVNPGKVAQRLNDLGCRVDTIAFGPAANEELMQIIAGAHSGDYYYAPDDGLLAAQAAGPAAPAAIAWQNELARSFDHSMTKAAGRQRIQSFFGAGEQGIKEEFFVSEFDDLLVLALKWLNPGAPGEIMFMRIFDPGGNELKPVDQPRSCAPLDYPATERYCSETNEVVRVADPRPGLWTVEIGGEKPSNYVLMGNVRSSLRLDLAAGDATAVFKEGSTIPQGFCIPIVGLLTASRIGPVAGADVNALVEAPDGSTRMLHLFDDGMHQDGLADDGAYVNLYCGTAAADFPPSASGKPWQEGEEIRVRGSYQVEGTAVWKGIRREARTSFAMAHDKDEDGDGMGDSWERSIDPNWPLFPNGHEDPDRDRLLNVDEFNRGTHPLIADTDGGGENDGSEVAGGRDPLDPSDDLITPAGNFFLRPDSRFVALYFLLSQNSNGFAIWRRPLSDSAKNPLAGEWQRIIVGDGQPGVPLEVIDRQVENGVTYEYQVESFGSVKGASVTGGFSGILPATPKEDPAPPEGFVEINGSARSTTSRSVELAIVGIDHTTWQEDEGPAALRTSRPAAAAAVPAEMRLSNDGAFPEDPNVGWLSYQADYGWELAVAGSGVATVYIEFRDASDNISQAPATDSIFYCQPDANNDQYIGAADLQQIADRWLAVQGDGNYDAWYDMDGDGDVDIVDIMLAAALFNTTCS